MASHHCLLFFLASLIAVSPRKFPANGKITICSASHNDGAGKHFCWKSPTPIEWNPLRTISSAESFCADRANTKTICFSVKNATAQRRRQKIDGFGGSFLRSGAIVLNLLSEDKQQELLRDYFAVGEETAGFSVGKIESTGCDENPISYEENHVYYTYWDRAPWEGGKFSMDVELTENGTIPFVQRAQKHRGSKLLLQAASDYMPVWMQNQSSREPVVPYQESTSVNMSLYPYQAEYWLNFVRELHEHDIDVYAIMHANEPAFLPEILGYNRTLQLQNTMGSYQFASVEQLTVFTRDYLKPLFRKSEFNKTRITYGSQYGRRVTAGWWPDPRFDANHFYRSNQNYTKVALDADVDIFSTHGYDCGDTSPTGYDCKGGKDGKPGHNATCVNLTGAAQIWKEAVETVRQKRGGHDLPVWVTENCLAVEFSDWQPDVCPHIPYIDFNLALTFARFHFADVWAGATASIHWTMFLDAQGGPYAISPRHNNPTANYQQPMTIVDWKNNTFHHSGIYYAYAIFSRATHGNKYFLDHQRTGDLVVNSNIFTYGVPLQQAVFANDTHVSVVLMNDQEETFSGFSVVVDEFRSAIIDLPPASIVVLDIPLDDVAPPPPGRYNHKLPGYAVALVVVGCLAVVFF